MFSAHLEPRSLSGPRQPWEAAAVRGQSPPPGLGDKPSGERSSRHCHQVCLAQGFCSAAGGVREWPWQLTCPEAARPDVHSDMHAHGVHTHTHKRVRHNRTDPTHTLLGRPRTHKPPQQRPCPCGRGDSSSPTHRTPASSSKLGALLPVGRAACWAAAARPAHPHTLTPPKHFPSMGRPPGRPRKARSCHSAEAGWGRVGRALARTRTGGKGRVLRPVSESLASMSGHGCT